MHSHVTFETFAFHLISLEMDLTLYYILKHTIYNGRRFRDGSVIRGRYTNVVIYLCHYNHDSSRVTRVAATRVLNGEFERNSHTRAGTIRYKRSRLYPN